MVCVLGEPVDLMARRVLAAATNELAQELSQYLGRMDLPRDDSSSARSCATVAHLTACV